MLLIPNGITKGRNVSPHSNYWHNSRHFLQVTIYYILTKNKKKVKPFYGNAQSSTSSTTFSQKLSLFEVDMVLHFFLSWPRKFCWSEYDVGKKAYDFRRFFCGSRGWGYLISCARPVCITTKMAALLALLDDLTCSAQCTLMEQNYPSVVSSFVFLRML